MVKANAYGLGMAHVSKALRLAGCRSFFVATLSEGLELKRVLDDAADIYVLSGLYPGDERRCAESGLIPVIVSLEMLHRWLAATAGMTVRSSLKVDTGMGRLGLSAAEFLTVIDQPNVLSLAGVELVISHLACSDEPDHELNQLQLSRFENLRKKALSANSSLRFSLANSSGVCLGERYHFDLLRPGVALFGEGRVAEEHSQIKQVVSLSLPILMVRRLKKGEAAGYGATFVASQDCDIACIAGGYADGLFRTLSNSGNLYLDGRPAPIVGRISMDSVLVDVSGFGLLGVDAEKLPNLELLGPHQNVNQLARQAQTVAYEILTSIGDRFHREYSSHGQRRDEAC